MRKQSLRRTTLLSLIGLRSAASAQATSSWGTPFSVDSPSTATLLASNPPLGSSVPVVSSEAPPPSQTPQTPSLQSSEVSLISGTLTPSDATSFTVTLPTPTGSQTTVSTPISQSVTTVTQQSSSTSETSTGSSSSESSTLARSSSSGGSGTVIVGATTTGSTGGAPAPTGYVKMGIAGVIAGAAGVFII